MSEDYLQEASGLGRWIASRRSHLTLRFTAASLLTIAVALGIFYLVMQPQQRDLAYMALFLTVTAAITVLAGYAAHRLGWIGRAPSLRWALLSTYILSSLMTFINVWITARLMFVSEHDLLLATILLLFASGIAVALGAFFAETLSRRIQHLRRAVDALEEQGLSARSRVEGRDEIAELARAFNTMAAQLEKADRKRRALARSRRQLIAWVSHDLQTPLTSIRAIIEALADGMIEDERTTQRYLSTAKREVESLSVLIDDLFEIARMDAQGLELSRGRVSLSDLISDTLESFSAVAAGRGVTLEGSVDFDHDTLWIDAGRISRVLNNLVNNALRHTLTGGSVQVRAERTGAEVVVEVRDTGEGVEEESLPHLFEPFYRGEKSRSRRTGGAGLGLSIAKGFVEAHGGRIGARPNPDGGAIFRFTLPG